MLVARIAAKPDTDIELEVNQLRKLAGSSKLPPSKIEDILVDVRSTLGDFLARGQKISATGSQIAVSRSIAGDDYKIVG